MKSKIQSIKERVVSFFDPKGIEVEMLRYRPNKASYKMTLFGIIAFALAFAIHYSGTSISGSGGSFSFLGSTNLGFWNFFDILLNILLLLFFLTSAMEMEAYSVRFGIAAIAGGVFQALRPLLFVLAVFQSGNMNATIFGIVTSLYIVSGVFIVVSGILAIIRGTKLRAYLKDVAPMQNERIGK